MERQLVGKIIHWTRRGFGFVEIRNPQDGSLDRFFLHIADVIRQYPEEIERGCYVRFTPDADFKPKSRNQVPPARSAEIFWPSPAPAPQPIANGGAR